MSMIGELTFFLGIQVKQMKQGTFMHQAKYTNDLMKKFNMAELKPVSTLMSTATSLSLNKNGEVVDQREYRSMIDSLLYLTMTWPDIQFVVCLCARFQASHTLRIGQQFSGFLGISNTHSSLGFGIMLLLH
jgi:isopentenyldiphosphate isomerase